MPWQLALLGLYAAGVVQTLVQRRYSQSSKLPLSIPAVLSYLLGVMPVSIVVGLLIAHHIHWSWHLLVILGIEGFLIGSYNWLSFRAIAKLTVAQFMTIFQLYELVVIGLSWPLLHETLTFAQAIGAIFILAGALLSINTPRAAATKRITGQALLIAGASALALGSGLVAEKVALRSMDAGAYFIIGFGFQTFFLLLFAMRDVNRQTITLIRKRELKLSMLYGLVTSGVGFTYIAAIVNSNNVSLIAALGAFSLPLTVLASYLFLHERENMRRLWMATGLACIGLVISAL